MRIHEEHVGAPSRAQLDEADMARCERCHDICEVGELDDAGLCGECQPAEDDGQVQHQIERSAGGY